MIASIHYGERWSTYYHDWLNPCSEAEAHARHERQELYSAFIEQHDGARLVLELCFAFSYCNIYFLDTQGRCDLRYTFEPTADGRLFLCEIATGEYEGDELSPKRGISRSFKQEGRMNTLLSVRGRLTVLGENEPVDVTTHYEAVPRFKEWESLIRKDRS